MCIRDRSTVDTVRERHRAVVVGTGFGGAVTAFRLAEAGVPAVVLERGRRWPVTPDGDTFPPVLRPDRRSSWLTPHPVYPGQPPVLYRPYVGLFEKVVGHNISVICGAGVGGGSLVYGGVMIRPPREVFTRVVPASVDFDELDRVHYPRVAGRIGIGTIPDDVLAHERYWSSRLFLDQAARAGLPTQRLTVAVDWNLVRAELQGRARPAASVGEYLNGLNGGARPSVDRNYLAWAEASGRVEVRPLHVVTGLGRDGQGRYVVRCDQINEDGEVLLHRELTADAVFLAAGSMGTTRLLVRARDTGALPGLPEDVGRHWGNNGDQIYFRALVPEPTGAHQGGPICVAVVDWNTPDGPVVIQHGPAPFPIDAHAMAVPGFGLAEPRGRFEYSPVTDRVTLHWPAGSDRAAQQGVRAVLRQLVSRTGGPVGVIGAELTGLLDLAAGGLAQALARLPGGSSVLGPLGGLLGLAAAAPAGLIDYSGLDPVTFHPLGGAVIGAVCDDRGRVHDHPGLYVVDGSLLPGSTGACNPAWTIAALAERAMDDVLTRDVGAVF